MALDIKGKKASGEIVNKLKKKEKLLGKELNVICLTKKIKSLKKEIKWIVLIKTED